MSGAVGHGLLLAGRMLLGGVLAYMGLHKAMDPIGFLKLVREYHMVEQAFWLNGIAAVVPWLEVFCGLLLIVGLAVRGTALVTLGMLIAFTALVAWRAVGLQTALQLPFCAVRFDCGCGGGVVWICHKLLENGAMMALAAGLVWAGRGK